MSSFLFLINNLKILSLLYVVLKIGSLSSRSIVIILASGNSLDKIQEVLPL